MPMESKSCEIERNFEDIPADKITESEQTAYLMDLGWHKGINWTTLLESKRVLIISEAGAGKTYECRKKRNELWYDGQPAFFIELSTLANGNLRDLFSFEEENRFDAWRAARSDVATFFLDSIDELKLTLGSFEQALKRLAKAIDGQLGRVRVIITSRPIPIDEQLFRQILPIPDLPEPDATEDEFADIAMGNAKAQSSEAEFNRDWRNVALLPLSTEQIAVIASNEGSPDSDALLGDIKKRNAEDFVRRPQDLIELCADWREHRRIRSHHDQVASNVAVKLRPRDDRRERAPLSADKALEGARRLALAATLSRKLTIRHSAEADRTGDPIEAPLDPSRILHDWSQEECTTLLERPLFGMASYGRVRFHHRSVVEYLAAEYLLALRVRGMPAKSIKRILFTTAQGDAVIKPSLRPVAAWMALQDDVVLEEILAREPDVLLNHGDPESLPLAQRQRALRAYVERHRAGGWRGLLVPRIQLHRFASPDLGPEVKRLWTAGIENHEVREILLELAGLGKMDDCADICHDVAMNALASQSERIEGLKALIQIEEPRLTTIASSVADNECLWPDRLAQIALLRLFPSHLSVELLCRILKRVTAPESRASDLSWTLPRLAEKVDLSPAELDDFRRRITELAEEGPCWEKDEWPHLASKRQFLLPVLAAICLRMMTKGFISPDVMHSVVIALCMTEGTYDGTDQAKALATAFAEAPLDARRLAFEAQDTIFQRYSPEPNARQRYARLAYNDRPVQLGPSDMPWIVVSLSDRNRPADYRAMLLQAAISGRDDSVSWLDHLASLKPCVADLKELVDQLDEYAKPPPPDPNTEQLRARIKALREQERRREAKSRASWQMFRRNIIVDPEKFLGPDHAENTARNLWRVMYNGDSGSRASGWNRRLIERHFGKDTADRLRTAFMAYWRANRPELRSERAEADKNKFFEHWLFGLAGIVAESEDSEWAKALSNEDAKLALRYAPLDLNGFPAWLDDLAAVHPEALDDVLGVELTAELAEPASSHSVLLQSVRHGTDTVARHFVPRLRDWLDARNWLQDHETESVHTSRLTQVLQILLRLGDTATLDHVRALARAELSEGVKNSSIEEWLPVLMHLSPSDGIEALEKTLLQCPPSKFGTATEWFSRLFSFRRRTDEGQTSVSRLPPNLLLRLARLAFRHIRPTDDMNRGPGHFTPNVRDHAEDGRSNIINALFATKGPEGWAAKIEFAHDPLFADYRDRAISVARERASEDADALAYSEGEILALDQRAELPPLTRDDMFTLLSDRLEDLADLLLRDDSPRAAWALIEDETIMRQQIARELRRDANGAYTVDQEAVTAEQKETDIRLRSTGSEQEAVIELKIGEKNYSAADLTATLRNQIVTKYLAPEHRRCGCLLITVTELRTWRHPVTKAILDLDGLMAMLNEEASKIEKEMGNGLRLIARGLDLRPRLSTESARAANRKDRVR
ncbi:hypothetical protein L2U69_18585 [Zavarzinia compransoris]|uniref:hypothetical protein n=1 Tax=Zavarzinia marina TaxID=2911065 RepID=UPI001F292123|nr:hypothetical protein [Zavarzinia marina]MCF4167659.1 hypothetical protein [Zavarzinia marina]